MSAIQRAREEAREAIRQRTAQSLTRHNNLGMEANLDMVDRARNNAAITAEHMARLRARPLTRMQVSRTRSFMNTRNRGHGKHRRGRNTRSRRGRKRY